MFTRSANGVYRQSWSAQEPCYAKRIMRPAIEQLTIDYQVSIDDVKHLVGRSERDTQRNINEWLDKTKPPKRTYGYSIGGGAARKYGFSPDGTPRPEEQECIKLIHAMRANGEKYPDIANALNSRGYKPMMAEKWTAAGVTTIARRKNNADVYNDHRRPYGFTMSGEPYEPEHSVLMQIQEWHESGMGYTEIANTLNERGIKSRMGKTWDYSLAYYTIHRYKKWMKQS